MSLLRFCATITFRGHATCEEMRERIERIVRTHPHLSFRADHVEVVADVPPVFDPKRFDPAGITPWFEPGGTCGGRPDAATDETCVAAVSAEVLEFSPWYQLTADGQLSSRRDGWCRGMPSEGWSTCTTQNASVGCAA